MKPRVMFVDDDPMLQASTRRQLLMKLPDYELIFCDTGREALEIAAIAAPEIIFSDVRMPEMDGPELLRRLGREYPGTVRFALTGQSDESQMHQVYSAAHQVFSKPCETEQLREVIETTVDFRAQFRQSWLLPKLTKPGSTPPNLRQIAEVIKLLEEPGFSAEDLASRFEQDSAINGRLQKIVNSLDIARTHPVTDAFSAIAILGFPLANAIYVAAYVNSMIELQSDAALEMNACMNDGIAIGIRAYKLIEESEVDQTTAVPAMISCLFHSFGRVQLALHGGKEYSQLRQKANRSNRSLAEIERDVFGISHETAGGYVLHLWGLSAEICKAIANQNNEPHSPARSIERILQESVAERKSLNCKAPRTHHL